MCVSIEHIMGRDWIPYKAIYTLGKDRVERNKRKSAISHTDRRIKPPNRAVLCYTQEGIDKCCIFGIIYNELSFPFILAIGRGDVMNFEIVMRAFLFGPMIAFIVLLFLALPQALHLCRQRQEKRSKRMIENMGTGKTVFLPLLVNILLPLGILESVVFYGVVIAKMLRRNEYIVIDQLQGVS